MFGIHTLGGALPAASSSGFSLSGAASILGNLGGLFGGLGGLFGGRGDSITKQEELMHKNHRLSASLMREQADIQREFAKNSVRWRVEDANAAGIHPIYAMGAPTASFSASVGSSVPQPTTRDNSNRAAALANMGQDIGRAIDATRTTAEKVYARTQAALSLENMGLQNDLLRSQINRINQQTGPDFPGTPTVISGQGDAKATIAAIKTPDIGYKEGTVPLHVVAINEKGDPIRVYNTNDLGDNETLQFLHSLGYSMPDVFRGHTKRFMSNFKELLSGMSMRSRPYRR